MSCKVCDSEENLKACGGCQTIKYCSRECQQKDWSEHKEFCLVAQKVDNSVASAKFGEKNFKLLLCGHESEAGSGLENYLENLKSNFSDIQSALFKAPLMIYAVVAEDALLAASLVNLIYKHTEQEHKNFLRYQIIGIDDIYTMSETLRGTPLFFACTNEDIVIVKLLLSTRLVNADKRFPGDPTPLIMAIKKKNEELVKLLISYGADVSEKVAGFTTPLEFAESMGNVNIIQQLVEAGATKMTDDTNDD